MQSNTPEEGVAVVGSSVVGALVVGALVLGTVVVGDCVVGAAVVGAVVVGAKLVGAVVVGAKLVGAVVVGELVGARVVVSNTRLSVVHALLQFHVHPPLGGTAAVDAMYPSPLAALQVPEPSSADAAVVLGDSFTTIHHAG